MEAKKFADANGWSMEHIEATAEHGVSADDIERCAEVGLAASDLHRWCQAVVEARERGLKGSARDLFITENGED